MTRTMNHATFQIISTTPQGMECGTGWFCTEANEIAKQRGYTQYEDALYALTNAHVVANSESLFSRHQCMRRTDLPISVVGVAEGVDLACVKITGSAKQFLQSKLLEKTGISQIPTISLVDSDVAMPANYDALNPAHAVVAVGFPLGSEFQTATKGVVEAWKRVPGQGEASLYLATTATIQPGNSGGPLLFQGNAIGINSMKATGATTDNLNMAIPSRRIASYLPHLVSEEQTGLSVALVQLANHLDSQGLEAKLLEALEKQHAIVGRGADMQAAYNAAMQCENHTCSGGDVEHPTLKSFMRAYAHEPGFHSLFSKVSHLLHTGNLEKVHRMACRSGTSKGFADYLCQKCSTASAEQCDGKCGNPDYDKKRRLYASCVTAVPAAVVHSPELGFEYRPTSALSLTALGLPRLQGGVVVSSVLPWGPTKQLKKYDVVSAVKTSDGLMRLDEQGEHYSSKWGLSLGLADLVERAPMGSQCAFQIHRDGRDLTLGFKRSPLSNEERPAVRLLDRGEQHLNTGLSVGGCTFKILRLNDLADPRIAQSSAVKYAAPSERNATKIIVAGVSEQSVAFHNYSLMPGMVVSELNKTKLSEERPWQDFCEKLVEASQGNGVMLLGTECGGCDAIQVSPQEGAALVQYLQQTI